MPSLEKRVALQREVLRARGLSIRLQAGRVHQRLGHPVFLMPAFLGGMLLARGVPLMRALFRLTGRLRLFMDELGKLNTIIRLIAELVPVLLSPSLPPSGAQRARAEGEAATNASSSPEQQKRG